MELFAAHPRLCKALPHIRLGTFPTPVRRLERLAARLGMDHLYVKDDGLSAPEFGGNKVRKLEFLLAAALRRGAREVLTFGYAGSNHAAATAFYAKRLGLRSISMLLPQPNAAYVRRNLLVSHACGAELHHHPDVGRLVAGTSYQLARHRLTTGRTPMVIRAGGSSPLGTLGYVAAAYELAEQVARGEMPEPDAIYVAFGSMGTAVGLALGLAARGLTTRVVAVQVVDRRIANRSKAVRLFARTAALLHRADPSFPELAPASMNLELREEFFGGEYGRFTAESVRAVTLAREDGLELEGTYTGKALAALIADAEAAGIRRTRVLFWNTHNARDLSHLIEGTDYRSLPTALWRYFEEPLQALDIQKP
ncbi:MAG: pyridoxal-phosphate dependent enzyme [Candidatus Dadabacteria bacterium]|nr:MAG: pyridoxal-phosphate dependent enzyme [Candidatus Dadabacteria bacterium]